MATITSNSSGNWATGSTWVGGVKPSDNDAVVIAAGHSVLMNDDLSAYTGLQTVTIQGSSSTPGMLYFKDGTSGHLKIRTGYNLVGTTGTNLGRLLANSDGVWGNTGSLAYANKAVINLQGTALINAQYLDIALHCTEPTRKYVRTYGTKYDFTASGSTVDTVNDTINLGTTPPSAGTAVMITGTDLPGGLQDDYIYYVRAVSGNTCKLATQNADVNIVNITSTGSGTCTLFTGHTNTSTATMNVLEDVTADNWAVNDTAVLADAGPADYDQQRITINTINAGSIVLSANIDSTQYPGARIYLSRRNVSVRSAGTSTSQAIIDFSSAATRSGKFGCEIINTAGTGTTYYGYGVNSGSGHTISGTVSGCSNGVIYGSGHTISGTVSGCSNGVYYGSGHTISGTVSGCSSGVNSGSGHTISGTVSGCSNGVNSGSGHTISGTVSGCSNGVIYGSGHTISGTVSGCTNGVNYGSGHTISGTVTGCSSGVIYGSGNTISGTVTGCGSGVNYSGFTLYGSVSNNTTNFSYIGITAGPKINGRGFLSTGIFSWSAGGKMEHETSIIPTGYQYSHKFTYENGSYANKFQLEIYKVSAPLVQIPCFAKHDTTGLTADQRLHFQLINLGTEAVLAEWISSDSTEWQTGTISYTNNTFVPMALLITATRESGVAYALTGASTLSAGGVYTFGG